jgi:hypothetical protein
MAAATPVAHFLRNWLLIADFDHLGPDFLGRKV